MPYTATQIVSLVLLTCLLLIQHKYQGLLKKPCFVFITTLSFIITSLSIATYLQWSLFSSSEPAKFLLPPYAPWTYFIQYVWSWIWSQYLLALGGALLIALGVWLAPKPWKELRFSEGEPLLIVSGLLLVGHPYWIFYIGGVLLLYCIYTLARAWRAPTRERVSFFPFWIPTALLVVLVTPILKELPLMQLLSITLS